MADSTSRSNRPMIVGLAAGIALVAAHTCVQQQPPSTTVVAEPTYGDYEWDYYPPYETVEIIEYEWK